MQNMKNHITWWWWWIDIWCKKTSPKNALDKSQHGLTSSAKRQAQKWTGQG